MDESNDSVYDAQRETNELPNDDVKDMIKRLLEEENERQRRANQYLNLIMRHSTKEESDRFKDSYTHT